MRVALTMCLLCISTAGLAHGNDTHAARAAKEQTEWGIAGSAKGARTIRIRMLDTMRFVPAEISVRKGETVRFVISNEGKMLHEFVMGTPTALGEHAALMMKFPDMEHGEPWMAHVGAGARNILSGPSIAPARSNLPA